MGAPSRLRRVTSLLLGLGLSACGGGGGGVPAPDTGGLQVRMRDCPLPEIEHVYVTVERVDILRDVDGVETRETVASTPAQHDLLELQDGVEAVLGGGQFPPGDYHWIRLIVAKDSREDVKNLPADQLANYVVVGGKARPLVVPSGAETGIKLGHDFTIAAGGTTTLTLDFDLHRSVFRAGRHRGVYVLRPHIKVVANQGEAAPGLSGTVQTTDGTGLPAGTMVSVQQGGVEVASAEVDGSTGAWTVTDLVDGTYDVVAIAPGYGYDAETGVAVVSGDGGTGHALFVAPAGVGAIYGAATPAGDGVAVKLYWNGFLVGSVAADAATGDYLFDNLPAGDFTVTATNGTSTASSPATVTSGGATQVDLGL